MWIVVFECWCQNIMDCIIHNVNVSHGFTAIKVAIGCDVPMVGGAKLHFYLTTQPLQVDSCFNGNDSIVKVHQIQCIGVYIVAVYSYPTDPLTFLESLEIQKV